MGRGAARASANASSRVPLDPYILHAPGTTAMCHVSPRAQACILAGLAFYGVNRARTVTLARLRD
jgi:hypothetical protein